MPYPPWASPSQCFQVLSPAQPPQAANLLLGRGAWMGHISGLPNDRALENCLYLKQVVAQVLMVQGSLLGRELVSRLCSTSSFGNLFTASPSSSFPHRQFLTKKKKTAWAEKHHSSKEVNLPLSLQCLCCLAPIPSSPLPWSSEAAEPGACLSDSQLLLLGEDGISEGPGTPQEVFAVG